MKTLLQLQKGSKSYGDKVLFNDATFAVNEGEHIGVIGPNGAGKSTLFKILAEKFDLDEGQVVRARSLTLGYLEQEENWDTSLKPIEWLETVSGQPEWKLTLLLNQFGLTEEHLQKSLGELSGGFRMRVKLTSLIAREPNVLLLDEPTNYLDLETLLVLENFLLDWKGAFLLISHDREFLTRVTDQTLEVESGDINKFPGNIEDYFEQKRQLAELLAKQAQSLENKRKQIIDFANRFGAKATKAKQVQSRLKSLSKMESISVKPLYKAPSIPLPQPTKTSRETLVLKEADIGYGEQAKVLNDVSFRLERTDKLAIVGINGAGKSTLLKTLAGQLDLMSGETKVGHGVRFGYFAQHNSEILDPKETVLGELQKAAHFDVKPQELLDLAGSLLFSGDDIHKKVSVLSGGERSRVALGQILLKKCPCLLLDEPTNHLDFQTVEALASALQQYPGTVVVVSHDRSFIKTVASKILEIRDGKTHFYPGNYDEYVWSVQKGVLSENVREPVETKLAKSSGSKKGTNYKSEKKRLEKLLREARTLSKSYDEEIQKLNRDIDTLNEQLLQEKGEKAAELAKELHRNKDRLQEIEQSWLEAAEKIEGYESELNDLLS